MVIIGLVCIFLTLKLRDDFKTQPPVDVRIRPVPIVLNNDNRPEPAVIRRLGFEVAP